jgi:hypothetical protein
MAEAGSGAASGGTFSGMTERSIYQASAGRKLTFSFIFLLLLPFFVSLGPMLWMRIRSGLWHDLAGFLLFALLFAVLMGLILAELIRSLRTRISLGAKALHMTVPNGRGPTPFLKYASHDIPYDQIAAVETRREIYGGWLAPVLLQGARVVTKDGRNIRIGYVNEANIDPAFPYPEIARQIAARAGLAVADSGNVRRSAAAKMLGFKSADPTPGGPVGDNEIAALNRAHRRFMLGLTAGLLALVGASLLADVMASPPQVRASREAAPQPAPAPGKK